jgi:hypothetical protein
VAENTIVYDSHARKDVPKQSRTKRELPRARDDETERSASLKARWKEFHREDAVDAFRTLIDLAQDDLHKHVYSVQAKKQPRKRVNMAVVKDLALRIGDPLSGYLYSTGQWDEAEWHSFNHVLQVAIAGLLDVGDGREKMARAFAATRPESHLEDLEDRARKLIEHRATLDETAQKPLPFAGMVRQALAGFRNEQGDPVELDWKRAGRIFADVVRRKQGAPRLSLRLARLAGLADGDPDDVDEGDLKVHKTNIKRARLRRAKLKLVKGSDQ